ncbi:MAG: nucleotidyltransferase domain-containing protein [Methanothrix sp.]
MIFLSKCIGFRVLEFFLTHPSEEIHLNELARRLEISPASVKTHCDQLLKEEMILEKQTGNLRLFRLNGEDFAVRAMMRAYHMLLLKSLGIEEIAKDCISLAVYGSMASGKLDERSDMDILVIGEIRDSDRDWMLKLEGWLGREVQLTVLPYYEWEKMKREVDRFSESVLKNHVLIKGAEL